MKPLLRYDCRQIKNLIILYNIHCEITKGNNSLNAKAFCFKLTGLHALIVPHSIAESYNKMFIKLLSTKKVIFWVFLFFLFLTYIYTCCKINGKYHYKFYSTVSNTNSLIYLHWFINAFEKQIKNSNWDRKDKKKKGK